MQRNPELFPISEDDHFIISGVVGDLEVKTHCPPNFNINQIGIICHPHPLYQGTMDNKVVTTAMRAFRDLEIPSVRFNYRGVGASQGSYGEGVGEAEDLLAVIKWVQMMAPGAGIHLVGFSFGAFIALSGAARCPEVVKSVLSLAPSVLNSPYASISPLVTCPWQVIMGTADEVVSVHAVMDWYKMVESQASLILLPKTGHFFHGKLTLLKSYIKQFLQS